MVNLDRLSQSEIETAVLRDINHKTEEQIEATKEFYYKILIEPELRTSSFRYFHAKCSLEGICKKMGDDTTINNLRMFHRQKVQFEIDNPVEKEPAIIKKNPASKADRFGNPNDKSASQVSF